MLPLVEDMSEIYAHPLPTVYAIFLFAIEYSAKAQHTTTGARALACVEPWLNTQWQAEKEHILLAEDRHIFLTCLQLVGAWVQNIFRNLFPDFWHDSQMDLDLNISSL